VPSYVDDDDDDDDDGRIIHRTLAIFIHFVEPVQYKLS